MSVILTPDTLRLKGLGATLSRSTAFPEGRAGNRGLRRTRARVCLCAPRPTSVPDPAANHEGCHPRRPP